MSEAPPNMGLVPLSGEKVGGFDFASRQLLNGEGAFGARSAKAASDSGDLRLREIKPFCQPLVANALVRHPDCEGGQFVHEENMRSMHIPSQEHHAWEPLKVWPGPSHNMRMAQKPHPKHFLREWRKHHGLSIDALIDRIKANVEDRVLAEGEEGDMKRLGLSQPNISRIERGDIPYNQTILELIAEVYGVDAASLIIRDPTDPDGLWTIYDQIPAPQKPVALRVLEGFKKTGTDG